MRKIALIGTHGTGKTTLAHELVAKAKKRGVNAKVVRLDEFKGGSDLEGTRRIIRKIIAAYEFQKEMERIEGK